jgi:hypothetical protein
MTGGQESRHRECQTQRLSRATADLARLIAQIDYENGNVSWSRETALARQKLEEAFMWAMKGISETANSK